jgi:predicted patatin/cPLA2 family phospholipase
MQGKQLEVDIMRGLIMEGGAMRGMFTCGVIDVFMEQGIEFDGAAGISAGAVFGCNIKSRQIGRPIRYNKKYCKDPRYCSIRSLLKTGDLYGVEFCYHELPDVLDPFDQDTFRQNPMAFYVGATDVNTGRVVFYKCSDGGETDIQWMRASSSMPVVSRPVTIGRYTLLDGGIACPVPYRFMEKKGYDRNVIILTQPEGYRKTKSPSALQAMLRRYPAISRAMGKRHIIYNRQMEQIEERERQGKAFVIRPPEDLKIGRTEKDPEELERVYQIGRRIASDASEKIRRFLSETTAG